MKHKDVPSFLFACLMLALLLAFSKPVQALECAINGEAPAQMPDDTGDGGATACGHGAVSGGTSSTALGYQASSPGNISTALGRSAQSGGFSSIAMGVSASSNGDYGTATGPGASALAPSSAAFGRNSAAGGDFSIALGNTATAIGISSAALGRGTKADGLNSIALGFYTSSPGANSTALGYFAVAGGDDSTALGYRAFSPYSNTLILGSIPGFNGAVEYPNIGIGTPSPSEALTVERSNAAARFQLTSFTNTPEFAPQYIWKRARGTAASPGALQSGDNIGLFSFRGHTGSGFSGSRAYITAQTAAAWNGNSQPTNLIFGTTPIGASSPQQVLVITHDGKVQVNGAQLSVPDYVFEDDYELMPLAEVKAFIERNGHLPGIPSASEVNANGLDLAGAPLNNLRKIEELTLYALEQETRVNELDARNRALEARNTDLEERLAALERLVLDR